MASRRERRQPKLIDKLLTFRKIEFNDLVSRKMVHSVMVASFRPFDCNENADRPRAGTRANCTSPAPTPRPHPEERCAASRLEGRGGLGVTKWPRGRRNPLKRRDSRKGKTLDFASPALDFASPSLGFSFLKAWIFLPQDLDFPSRLGLGAPARPVRTRRCASDRGNVRSRPPGRAPPPEARRSCG